MRFHDYYEVMQLDAAADAPAIKQAYRRLVRLHHPDLNGKPEAHAAMTQVNEAYEVLSDSMRRAAYDGVRRQELARRAATRASADMTSDWKQGLAFDGEPTPGRSGEAFSDFFTSMFGRAVKPEPANGKPVRGSDEHVKLMIDAADSVDGAVRAVTVRTLALDDKGHRAAVLRQIQLQIPKGIRAGQHLRLAGQGSAGRGGAAPGDLYVEVQFKQADGGDPKQSRDVHERLPLAPWEAALGAEVTTATPAGQVSVTVPPDTPHGKRLRLRGQGLSGEPAGDLVMEVEVVLPPSTLPGARSAYQAMAEIVGKTFAPRTSLRER